MNMRESLYIHNVLRYVSAEASNCSSSNSSSIYVDKYRATSNLFWLLNKLEIKSARMPVQLEFQFEL